VLSNLKERGDQLGAPELVPVPGEEPEHLDG
jgi:hypothetical protein